MTSISLRPAHFAPEPVLDSHITMKNSFPFQTTLYLAHLPPTIKPKHFDHILGQPPRNDGSKGRKRETGIKMVQIYTIPTEPSPTRHIPLFQQVAKSKLPAVLRVIFCLSSRSELDDQRSESAGSNADKVRKRKVSDESHHEVVRRSGVSEVADDSRPPSNLGTVTEEEVEDPYYGDSSDEEGEEEPSDETQDDNVDDVNNIAKKEEEGETVAYIHFCCSNHLHSAKRILSHLAIDGYRPKISTKRFNPGLVNRWARPISNGFRGK
ncbi:hypothetical protein IAR50_002557 [Cryptococcus sp. DSM 104548]